MTPILSRQIRSWCSVLAVLLSAQFAAAQSTGGRAADEAGVRQAGKDYLAAMERGDAKALAEFWTTDGTYTDETGRTIKVREALEKNAAAAGARASTTASNITVRFVTGDVAVEEGECETTSAAGGTPVKGRFTAMWVRQNGRWKLDSVRETRTASPSNAQPLASLEVFVGQWSGEINKVTVRNTAKWDANKKFLRRDFSMGSGSSAVGGRQEIGWDPILQQIKSWTFYDDGGHGEGIWSLEGNAWMVLSSRVFPDGRISTSTQVYKFPDKNTMVWKTIRGLIDGQELDDFEVVLKRSPDRAPATK